MIPAVTLVTEKQAGKTEKTPQCFPAQGPRRGWTLRLVLPARPKTQPSLDNRGAPPGHLQGVGESWGSGW